MFIRWSLLLAICLAINPFVFAQSKTNAVDKFRQLEEILPTPNEQRSASGAPGSRYWQQRADYRIAVEMPETRRRPANSSYPTPRWISCSPEKCLRVDTK